MIGASDEKTGPRLTANPRKATLIRDPSTGEAFKPNSPKGAKCLKRLKS